VQGVTADGHRSRNATGRGLAFNEVAPPGVLAVVRHPLAILKAVLKIEKRAACLDDRDGSAEVQLG
jgi:hypothetical protein